MSEHTSQLFRQKEYEVLHHIRLILELPHKCQELLSAEKTPTLSFALFTYEGLVLLWKDLAQDIPELSHYIDLGIAKIMEYVSKGRQSHVYALALSTTTSSVTFISTNCLLEKVINPKLKFKWIEEHWSASEVADVEKWMEDAVSSPISPVVYQYSFYCLYSDACPLLC